MSNKQNFSKAFAAAVLSLSLTSVANAQSSDEKPHHGHLLVHICAAKNNITLTRGTPPSDANKAKIDACLPAAKEAWESCKTKGLADGQMPTADERAATASCMKEKGYTMPTPPAKS